MKLLHFLLWFGLSAHFFSFHAVALPEKKIISITSHSPTIPILRGLSTNPVIRLTVTGYPHSNLFLNAIKCTLNERAWFGIQAIEAYWTDTENFSNTRLIGTTSPSSTTFEIPIQNQISPGVHYIWVSVRLKDKASIDQPITLHATTLVDARGKKYLIDEDNSNYTKRIGIALRKIGDEQVHTYRIPGIVTTDKGTLIAVYDVRFNNSADLPGNINVGMSRSTDHGNTWEPMQIIMNMGDPDAQNGIGDPAILFDPITQTIWVAALWSKGNHSIAGSGPGLSPDETGQCMLVKSTDDGKTWSAPINITSQVKNPSWKIFFQGPGNGICMKDGTIVFAAQYWDDSGMPYSSLMFSTDHGETWKRSKNAPKPNTTEAQIVETTPGTLMLNMRDNRGRYRSIATTTDMGDRWVEHNTSYNTLPDPICMGSFVKATVDVRNLPKDILFFSNPNTSGSVREKMTLKASLDGGQTWLSSNQVLYDERACYGYSSITKIDNQTLGILYEGTRELYFIKIGIGELIAVTPTY